MTEFDLRIDVGAVWTSCRRDVRVPERHEVVRSLDDGTLGRMFVEVVDTAKCACGCTRVRVDLHV